LKRRNVDSWEAAVSERENLGVKFFEMREVGVGEGGIDQNSHPGPRLRTRQNSRGTLNGKKVVHVDPPIPDRCV